MTEETSDLLYGAKAIAAFLSLSEQQARGLIQRRVIETFKMPSSSIVCARKTTLQALLVKWKREAREAAAKS